MRDVSFHVQVSTSFDSNAEDIANQTCLGQRSTEQVVSIKQSLLGDACPCTLLTAAPSAAGCGMMVVVVMSERVEVSS